MPLTDWAPTVAQVGARLRSRTTDDDGNELGTFTADTRPTGAQVAEIVSEAQLVIASEIGVDVDEDLVGLARRVVVYASILEIELSYFPEQVGTGRSPYAEFKTLYDEDWLKLLDRVAEEADEDGEETDMASGMPSYGFPANAGGMIGHGTEW